MPDKTALQELGSLPVPQALSKILAALEAETGTVHWLRSDGLLHLEQHAGGIPDALLPVIQRIPVGKGMAGLAAERVEPVQVCNLQSDASGTARPGARSTGMRGSICVPMMKGGQLVGVLGVAVGHERDFSDSETAWLLKAGTILAETCE